MKPALSYAAAIVLTTASFVVLQHIGNQTPLAVIAKKVVAEFEAVPATWGTRRAHGHTPGAWCKLTGLVLAGSASSTTPLHDAMVPRTPFGDFVAKPKCPELRRVSAAALAGVNATGNSEPPPPPPRTDDA